METLADKFTGLVKHLRREAQAINGGTVMAWVMDRV
jgi:hypothetical protein